MVSITDKFGKGSIDSDHAIATTVKTARTAGATVLEAYDVSKFADDTPVFYVTYKKVTDPVTGVVSVVDLVSYKALVNAGANTLTNIETAPGYTDIGNDEDDFIECIPTSYWGNSLINGILASLNPDGTLKANSVNTASILTDAIETVKIKNAQVTPDKLATGAANAYVATNENTTSGTYADLTTTTDTVTVTIGANGLALVAISAEMGNNTSNAIPRMAFAISGATTRAADDQGTHIGIQLYAASANSRGNSGTFLITGLTPGSTTFKAKYSTATGGSGAGTASFAHRRISVVPL